MAATDVLVHEVDPFDDNLVATIEDLLYWFRDIAAIVASDDNHHITTFDFHDKPAKNSRIAECIRGRVTLHATQLT